ncbi:hypothetical protein [Parasedimentitalea maritima]|uniref:DUF2157 domain-containing protein n=1 Tax=Parasedimentitalea maritima TaxID=2578117 RepID=A0A6A4REC3_9RHOB|nr:hypothetical protein [Zongyanglinia marina]KAE9629324.1 hypothetical protein GP644_12980 [Zongyanglinia marina]
MIVLADTDALVADAIIPQAAQAEIELRSRKLMVAMAINAILCFGILSATGGFIFWLASALSVAIVGLLFLGIGVLILRADRSDFTFFGNASALIGAGMLIGGAGIELIDKYSDIAGWVLAPAGALVAALCVFALNKQKKTGRFVSGSILLMGLALHLIGLGFLLNQAAIDGALISIFYLYATLAIARAGWFIDVRLITALAIVPFAQALDTSTFYFHAAYVFYSPESTLSILQMLLLVLVLLFVVRTQSNQLSRHAMTLAAMAFIVANLCALVGSLWGDYLGETLWGNSRYEDWDSSTYSSWYDARDAFRETAMFISANMYSVLWAIGLAGAISWFAHSNQRGLFNTAVTFACIHAYTQALESFHDEPLAYVIGGLAAIPLAWGLWRLDGWLTARQLTQADHP